MSTHWGFTCKTCQKHSETWVNHGEDLLRELFRIAPELNNILSKTDLDIDIKIMGFWDSSHIPDALEFLKTHENHEVGLINEDGDILAL